MLRRNLFLPTFFLLSVILFGQENDYNLPPGFHHDENIPVVDLSYKWEGIQPGKDYSDEFLRVLKDIPDNELKNAPPEYRKYVRDGKKWIRSLSSAVRNTYTETELWYIYAYDTDLKNKLKKVK